MCVLQLQVQNLPTAGLITISRETQAVLTLPTCTFLVKPIFLFLSTHPPPSLLPLSLLCSLLLVFLFLSVLLLPASSFICPSRLRKKKKGQQNPPHICRSLQSVRDAGHLKHSSHLHDCPVPHLIVFHFFPSFFRVSLSLRSTSSALAHGRQHCHAR